MTKDLAIQIALTTARIRIYAATMRIGAKGKEYEAPWLKNAKSVMRDASGQFYSKGADAADDIGQAATKAKDNTSKATQETIQKISNTKNNLRKSFAKTTIGALKGAAEGIDAGYREVLEPVLKKENPQIADLVDSHLKATKKFTKSLRYINPTQPTWKEAVREAEVEAAKEAGFGLAIAAIGFGIAAAIAGPEILACIGLAGAIEAVASVAIPAMLKIPLRASDIKYREGEANGLTRTLESAIDIAGILAPSLQAASFAKKADVSSQYAKASKAAAEEASAARAAANAADDAAKAKGFASKWEMEMCKILGLDSPPKNWDQVHKAYKAIAKKNHPDLGGSQEAMQQINEAFEWLRKNHPLKIAG